MRSDHPRASLVEPHATALRTTSVSGKVRRTWAIGTLALSTATWLAVTAYVHADLASRYDANQQTGTLSQGTLFRVQAIIAAVAAASLIASAVGQIISPRAASTDGAPRRRLILAPWLAAAAIGTSSLAAVMTYRYTGLGRFLFLPDMHEPVWYREKSLSAGADLAAALMSVVGIAVILKRKTPHAR